MSHAVRGADCPQTLGHARPDADLCEDGGGGGGDPSGADVSENKTLQTEIEMPLDEGV